MYALYKLLMDIPKSDKVHRKEIHLQDPKDTAFKSIVDFSFLLKKSNVN